MNPHTEPVLAAPAWRRLVMIVLLFSPLAALGASTFAAVQPKDNNPHGDFREDCGLCHLAKAWKPAKISPKFDHAKFGFALTGAHAAADCRSCHTSLEFRRTEARCGSCHEDPHLGELGIDCARCHGARSFVDRTPMVRAHQMTAFPLTGFHASMDCEACHPPAAQGQMQFVNTQAQCQSCHMEDYNAARNPDHRGGGFPTECASCHTPIGWNAASFDHSLTAFPLTGAHRSTVCASCHGDGVYQGKSTACVSCHQSDYDGTSDPGHVAAGFSTNCITCHTTASWEGSPFDHSLTAFPLTGAHQSTACASCHGDGVYQGKNTACVSCHQPDYDATTNPAHLAAGFSTDCLTCHTTATWTGATFDHDTNFFPIHSGTHRGKWSACSDCHTNAANYSSFTCLTCHPHSDRAKTDGDHNGESGYQYESASCYSCHPRGRS